MKAALLNSGRAVLYYAVILGLVVFGGFLYKSAKQTSVVQGLINKVLEGDFCLVIVCGPKGQILYANDRVKQYTGYSADELKAGGISLIIPPSQEQAHAIAYSKKLSKPNYGAETIHRRVEVCKKGGGRFTAAISIRIVESEEGPTTYAYILPDSVMDEAYTYPEFGK